MHSLSLKTDLVAYRHIVKVLLIKPCYNIIFGIFAVDHNMLLKINREMASLNTPEKN